MSIYALIDTVTPSPVIKRTDFPDGAPVLASEKGLRWIPDDPSSFDPAKETRVEASPVPVDAEEVPYQVSDIPLADLKALRKAVLATRRYQAEVGGLTLGGAEIGTDREDQAMITGAHSALLAGLIAAPIDWKGRDGFAQLSAETLTAIATAVAQHVQACFSHEAALSADIDACETAAAVLAVDLDAGWPS